MYRSLRQSPLFSATLLAFSLCINPINPVGAQEAGQTWNHDPEDFSIGPPVWGELDETYHTCGSFAEAGGTHQSPIDIVTKASLKQGLPPLLFNYRETALEVENNGHVVEVPYEPGSVLRSGGATYRLRQFHFHAPSEHTLDGRGFDAELHLVHMNSSGQIAVVGVFLEIGEESNPVIDDILASAPAAPGTVVIEGQAIDANELLPAVRSSGLGSRIARNYFTYPGSLTTPPCSEGVRWMVLSSPLTVSQQAVDRLHFIISQFPDYHGYPDNNRPLQPLNGRRLVRRAG